MWPIHLTNVSAGNRHRRFNTPMFRRFRPATTSPRRNRFWRSGLQDGKRPAKFLHWGLIPSWADDPAIGNRMINARADGVASKPSFRSAFKKS